MSKVNCITSTLHGAGRLLLCFTNKAAQVSKSAAHYLSSWSFQHAAVCAETEECVELKGFIWSTPLHYLTPLCQPTVSLNKGRRNWHETRSCCGVNTQTKANKWNRVLLLSVSRAIGDHVRTEDLFLLTGDFFLVHFQGSFIRSWKIEPVTHGSNVQMNYGHLMTPGIPVESKGVWLIKGKHLRS